MTRIIPKDQPLSGEDRAYLLMRGQEAQVRWHDDTDARNRAAEAEAVAVESVPDDGYGQMTVAELQAKIDGLNADGAEISPASKKKDDLVAALREYDALPDAEDEDEGDDDGI